jgi:hypothetical protein
MTRIKPKKFVTTQACRCEEALARLPRCFSGSRRSNLPALGDCFGKTKSASQRHVPGEVFYPSKQVIAEARLKDWDKLNRSAKKDFRAFWEAEAKELEWYGKWKKVLDDSKKAVLQMVHGGKVNIVHNCH